MLLEKTEMLHKFLENSSWRHFFSACRKVTLLSVTRSARVLKTRKNITCHIIVSTCYISIVHYSFISLGIRVCNTDFPAIKWFFFFSVSHWIPSQLICATLPAHYILLMLLSFSQTFHRCPIN